MPVSNPVRPQDHDPWSTELRLNAAKAEIKGLEIESTWAPTEKFLARLAVGYNKGKYKQFLSYNRLTGEVEDISDIFAFGFAPKSGSARSLPAGSGDWRSPATGNKGRPRQQNNQA